MRKYISTLIVLSISLACQAQKKPLDHTVYDGWQSIGNKNISNDGKWIVYNIDPQEGDNELVIQSSDASYKKIIPRGYGARITEDSRYVVFKIKPFFKDIREAKIKKKKPDESPKDSLGILELGKDVVWKKADVKTYKMPEKGFGWLAFNLEKEKTTSSKTRATGNSEKKLDSLHRVIDSLQMIIGAQAKSGNREKAADGIYPDWQSQYRDAEGEDTSSAASKVGTDLVLRNMATKKDKLFPNVTDYFFSRDGDKLLIRQTRNPKDSTGLDLVLLLNLSKGVTDTLSRGGNEFKNFVFADDGTQVAYVAERDAKPKDLQKFYKLWYYKDGMDTAISLVDKSSTGMKSGMIISEFGRLKFSKSGKRLIFGTAFPQMIKDTTLVEMDEAKLDIWRYNDDDLQTVQLNNLKRDLQKNFLAVYDFGTKNMVQLGSEEIPSVYITNEGDGDQFVGVSDFGKRIERQWTGTTKKDIYTLRVNDGTKKLIKKDLEGMVAPSFISPSGKYILWYDSKARNYWVYGGDSAKNCTAKIKMPLYDEENDVPSDPAPYGIMGWEDGDNNLLIYDRYDIWKIDPSGKLSPENITKTGRGTKLTYRYIRTDTSEKFIASDKDALLSVFNNVSKKAGFAVLLNNKLVNELPAAVFSNQACSFGVPLKAKDAPVYIYTRESYMASPNLYVFNTNKAEIQLSAINPQQKLYNWGTAELYDWKTFSGKSSTGILYKPADFDPTKKYPIIFYFYEKLSDGLYKYIPPAPTASRLNISFFVSRGYLVFAPDISYTIGHPAKSAYDYIVSAAKDLAKHKWVDAANMAIQGQSWGGIQVAQLVTMTDIFKAAWAGAPVANMTSAYGGIRWEGGVNRQFQYEKTQSRIGATLWEKPELYIENSPLFHLPKVKTPLVIMANDADGAVPWYQGIELFTGLRRLGKKVWMLTYNGEAHNLVQRRNRKDIQIREQQYFDWLLKGAKAPKWITEGVPAVDKGKDWGLEIPN